MGDKTFLSTLSKFIQPFPQNTVHEQNSQQNWNYNSGTCAFQLKSKVFTKTPNSSFYRFYLKYCLYIFLCWYIKVVWRKSQRVPTEPKKTKKRSSFHRCHCSHTTILKIQTFYPFSYTHQALQQPIQIYSLTPDPLPSRRFWSFNWFANFQEHLSS